MQIDMFPSHEEKVDEFSFNGPEEKLETQAIHEWPPASSNRSTYSSSSTSRVDNIWVITNLWFSSFTERAF